MRLINFHMDFDYKQYGAWMDKHNLKSEAINFMLLNPEIFNASEKINARTYTMFTNAISGIKKLDNIDMLEKIDIIAKGCFGNDTTVGALFVSFVNNNLDKLMSAEEILASDWKAVAEKIKSNVIKDGQYRADIASVLTMRLYNYIDMNFKNSEKADKIIKRMIEIVNYPDLLLTEDLILHICKHMISINSQKCTKLMLNPKIRIKLMN